MTKATVRGLAALQDRFAGGLDERAVKEALRKEAEALAAEARAETPVGLAQSIEVRDESRGTRIAYAIGTPDPAGLRSSSHGAEGRFALVIAGFPGTAQRR